MDGRCSEVMVKMSVYVDTPQDMLVMSDTTFDLCAVTYSNGSRSFKQYARPKLIRVMVDGEQVGDPVHDSLTT